MTRGMIRAQRAKSAPRMAFGRASVEEESQRAGEVLAFFGGQLPRYDTPWDAGAVPRAVLNRAAAVCDGGGMVLVTGASGSGKSTLLRAIAASVRNPRPISAGTLADRPVVELFGDLQVREVVGRLARVGLAEAGLLLRTPGQLSEGERYRLGLVVALEGMAWGMTLMCDEFCGLLDDVTAAVTARAVGRALRSRGVPALIATWREGLVTHLEPDLWIRCDFGEWAVVTAGKEG